MSLVGPRPPIAYEIEHYLPWHMERLKVTPGLTGLWQVNGRSSVPFESMVHLDVHYINNWSLWMDLNILLKTLPVIFQGTGGY
jgi:lipopolysaccharide/colanic/teichoic acid biosynthesis glycosyltransferase